jgi:hypothetical protein
VLSHVCSIGEWNKNNYLGGLFSKMYNFWVVLMTRKLMYKNAVMIIYTRKPRFVSVSSRLKNNLNNEK